MAKIKTFMDGNSWVAVDEDNFVNLAESDAGFGETEELAIADLQSILDEHATAEKDQMAELQKLVETYNEYMPGKMECIEISSCYYGLLINDEAITDGDYHAILSRITGIVKEEGLLFL